MAAAERWRDEATKGRKQVGGRGAIFQKLRFMCLGGPYRYAGEPFPRVGGFAKSTKKRADHVCVR